MDKFGLFTLVKGHLRYYFINRVKKYGIYLTFKQSIMMMFNADGLNIDGRQVKLQKVDLWKVEYRGRSTLSGLNMLNGGK